MFSQLKETVLKDQCFLRGNDPQFITENIKFLVSFFTKPFSSLSLSLLCLYLHYDYEISQCII